MTTERMGRRLAISPVVVLLALSTTVLLGSAVQASDRRGTFTEEFHQVYPLSAQGSVEIQNINGPVHITGSDRNEVKVDAVKSAWSKERLDEARIEVSAEHNEISIHTEYPGHDHNFNFGSDDEHNNPATVEYTITVPRQARLDKINLVNGRLDLQDLAGEVHASCVNGRIQAHNLQGAVQLETINGELDASVDRLPPSELKLSSVNGRLRLTLPSDTQAELKASTVSGDISDEFGLPVTRNQYVGRTLHGQLGGGGTLVRLSNVNGTIEIRHASDNRPVSPGQNLERERSGDKDDSDDL
ncbi:MAG TPA: DUF4097 family beta strand repeat-containing protein [Terriglobales bacterium]|nr:DUF4097 family beta strand repeat-containing protein [Terriglobales bacterium]